MNGSSCFAIKNDLQIVGFFGLTFWGGLMENVCFHFHHVEWFAICGKLCYNGRRKERENGRSVFLVESQTKQKQIRKAFWCAFPKTIPIFAGFWFLGISYGVLMRVNGFCFAYPLLMSMFIFGGSLEFVAGSMLMSSFAPLQTFLVSLVIQARHLFYGVSMLEKYKGTGWKKPYLIFGMCDESFSINCSAEIPADVDRGWFMFFVTLLNRLYWITGSTLGGLLGNLIRFNTEGLFFVMTAMFAVIFLDQWLKEKQHISSVIGIGISLVCLIVFGKDSFMIPTMLCIVVLLTAFRKPIERKGERM